MNEAKTVEPGHKVVTEGAEGESSTALDKLLENNGPYQPGMAPLGNNESNDSGGTAPAGGTDPGAGGDTNPDENAATGQGTELSGQSIGGSPENKYVGMEAPELRKLCKERGLKFANNSKVEKLIALLVQQDSDGAAPAGGTDPGAGGDDDLVLVILKKGASFRRGERVFEKGEPTAVDPNTAEKLIGTGMFVKG